MLATLGGILALLAGLAVLLLPLLALELSRPRDSVWGALVLLLGLVLVTSADRLTGSPMLGVLCGGLLIGRLGLEVGQSRWRQLSPEERQRLWSPDRWRQVLEQLLTSIGRLVGIMLTAVTDLFSWIGARRRSGSGKRWVRPELPEASAGPEPVQDDASTAAAATVREVRDFSEVDALLRQSTPPADASRDEPPEDEAPQAGGTDGEAGDGAAEPEEPSPPRDGTG